MRTTNRHFIQVAVLVFIVATILSGCSISPAKQQHLSGQYSDLAEFSIQLQQPAIDFKLPSAAGIDVTLSNILTEQHVLLIFYRGDWCPYCIDQFSTIQPVLPKLKQYNVKLVAVSPDELSAAQNTQRQFGQDYLFLMDQSLTVAKQYGLNSANELPHPAVFLIQRGRTIDTTKIIWFYASTDHTTRPTGEQLLEQVELLISKP